MRFPRPAAAPATRVVFCLLIVLVAISSAGRADVRFEGLSRTTEKAVRATVDLVDESCSAPEARVRRLYKRADRQVRQALEVYGYYAPTIEASLVRNGDCWQARFDIARGPRVHLRKVSIAVTGPGSEDPVLSRFLAQETLETGDGLNQAAYDRLKASLANLANRRGYFDGRFATSRIDVYPDKQVADISLDYVSGERYRFGPISLDQDVIDPELAMRFVEFKPGDPYDSDKLNELYTDLLASGYFQNIELRTSQRPAPDRDVSLTIVLTPAPPRTWTTGVGYATDSGPKLRLGFVDQRLNRKGHQFEFESSLAEVLGSVSLSYRLPQGSPRDEWLSFDVGYQYDNPEDSRSDEFRLGVKQIRRRGPDWRETRFIDYRRETYRVGETRNTSDLVIPGLSFARQPRLVSSRPRRGHRLTFTVSGTDEVLGSDTAFVQITASGKVIFPLWSTARLLARAETGWTIKDEFDDLPLSVRYFAGGDTSVRGYGYKSLGPTDADGNVIGGADKLVGSIEFDQQVFGNWSVAAFVDIGNAFNSFKAMSLNTGVGAGIRWYSPLGPIRFDVGIPLDESPDSFRIHITLGPDL